MTKPDLAALAARVEAGSGPDYALETLIAEALGWRDTLVADSFPFRWTKPDGTTCKEAPSWTSSLDAVVVLIAEKIAAPLDGWLNIDGAGNQWRVTLGYKRKTEGTAPTLPRSILAATLRALAAHQQDRTTDGD